MSAQELISINVPQESALAVFTAPAGLDPYLAHVRAEIDAFVPDVSTKKGRDAIASIAHKVAKSKTYLDGVGKELVDRLKEQPKLVDAERKRMRELLDGWKEEVRLPLTEWEQAEEKRVADLQARVAEFDAQRDTAGLSANEIQFRIDATETIAIDDSWQEYATEAAHKKDAVLAHLRSELQRQAKYEAEQAELARLRAEAAERDRIAAEEKAKREQEERERQAAERARAEAELKAAREQAAAEAKAKAEIEAAERRELEAKLAAERAEKEKLEAEQRAQAAVEKAEADRIAAEMRAAEEKAAAEKRAVEAERQRQEEEKQRLAEEERKREANKRHAAKINNEALAAFIEGGMTSDQAKLAVTLIAKRAIPHVSISY